MKSSFFLATFLFQALFLLGQSEPTGSPYFAVTSKNCNTESFPLKSTVAHVNISGVIADVAIEQTYANEGKDPIEAVYVFPGSTNSAVYGMEMTIGNRTIKARIEEKNKATTIYQEAKAEGKRASLLEQQRPNVFQMNVANIMPGDVIVVQLKYTELLVPEDGTYSFVYPTVVGPRYINGNEKTNTSFASMPYQHEGQAPKYTFDLSIHLSTGLPVQNITSPSHKITIDQPGPTTADIQLNDKGEEGNRDFVLQYNLKGKKIDAGMMVYDEGNEKFFLCMVQPPKQVDINSIPPREYIFVVDVSGSMGGFPLDVSKKLMTDLMLGLRPYDRFNVLLFSGAYQLLSQHSLVANAQNISEAITFVDAQGGGGGTELLNALQVTLNLPRDVEGLARSIVVVTDGYVGVDPEVFQLVRNNLDNANLFAFGIGSSVNRFLIEGLAKAGQGLPTIVLNQKEASDAAERFRKYIESPLLTQVSACFYDFDAYDVEPLTIPDVLGQRPIVLFGKFRGPAKGRVEINGYQGVDNETASLLPSSNSVTDRFQKVTLTMNLETASSSKFHSALKYLWARERIKRLSDFGDYNLSDEDKKEVTNLGLTYNLLTAYTSFVAVDDNLVNDEASNTRRVNQPLPMPEGVSDSAVGFSMGIVGMSGLVSRGIGLVNIIMIATLGLFIIFFWKGRRWMHGSYIIILVAFCAMSCSTKKETILPVDNRCAQASKITFILGDDDNTSNPYYQQAAAFYHQADQDGTYVVVDNIRSLQKLHEYLNIAIPTHGAWKEINLVIHGNQWTGIAMPIADNSEERTNADNLKKANQHKEFKSFPDAIVNEETQVNIYGCSIGKDTALVRQFVKFFTNQSGKTPALTASPNFNVYYSSFEKPGEIHRLEANCFYVASPIGKTPTIAEIAKALKQKYPTENISWVDALSRQDLAPGFTSYAHQFSIPLQWTFLYENEKDRPSFRWQDEIRRWVKNQTDLNQTLTEMQFKPEDFWWTSAATEQKVSLLQTLPAIQLRGSTRIYCVLVPILANTEGC